MDPLSRPSVVEVDHDNNHQEEKQALAELGKTSRVSLPVPQPDKVNLNLWSYLKQCIGKELTKITMPVHWNEPLSLLQVLSKAIFYRRVINYHTLENHRVHELLLPPEGLPQPARPDAEVAASGNICSVCTGQQ